jgi:hypothetical protein
LGAKAVPPLRQYFSRLQKKAEEAIADPKEAKSLPLAPFYLQMGYFLGGSGRDSEEGD